MSHKSERLINKGRVAINYNQPWRGFTLQRGHIFGETADGIYFVSGLECRAGRQNESLFVYHFTHLPGSLHMAFLLASSRKPDCENHSRHNS